MFARRKLCALFLALPAAAAAPLAALAAPDPSQNQRKKGGGVSYIAFPTLTATIFRADGQRGVLTVEAGVDIADPTLRARANLSVPRLRAAYVQMLQTYAAGLAPGAPPDADYIARSLQAQTDRVLGRRGAKLLLGSILIN
jgi:hypothetical protein